MKSKKTENKKKLSQFINNSFSVGDKVRHDDFGSGTILGISEDKLQIRFDRSKEIIKIFSDYVSKFRILKRIKIEIKEHEEKPSNYLIL